MHYAIIAAGEGSRLQQEGAKQPKPLIPVAGMPLLGRLVHIFSALGAESISVICNEQATEVIAYLEQLCIQFPLLHYLVQSTPSSMHSFFALSKIIPAGRFCLTTVDTVFLPSQFTSFIEHCESLQGADGYFAVTPFVDDEKPLWVATTGEDCTVQGFYDRESDIPSFASRYVSGGIYCLDTHTAFPLLQTCLEQGQSRMRNYQRALLKAGLCIKACVFPKIMDIDHLDDVRKAEEWLAAEQQTGGFE